MNKHNAITLFFFLVVSKEVLAHPPIEGDVWVTAGPFFHRTNSAQGLADKSPFLGGGLAVEADVDTNGGVEIAMLYEDKLYIRRMEDAIVAERIKRMYITTGYRHWFIPNLSAGIAFFSSYSMGDAKVIFDNRPLKIDAETTTANDITEYGFDLSMQWEFWSKDDFAFVADTRYSISAARKSRQDADLYGLLLGFKYLIPKAGSNK